MKQSLQLKIGQSLTMTPQLQQAIRLLQLSSLEMQQEIQQAIETNPMLEMVEDGQEDERDGDDTDGADAQLSEDRDDWDLRGSEAGADGADGDAGDTGSTSEDAAGLDGKAADDRSDPGSDGPDEWDTSAPDSDWQDTIPEDLPVDSSWDDVYTTATSSATGASGGDDFGYDDRTASSESLADHLLWQLNLSRLSDRDRDIAIALIDSVDADGMLRTTLLEIVAGFEVELDVEEDEVEAVLHLLQQFDPPGICARDLRECLLLQLRELPADTFWRTEAISLLDTHMDLLAARDYATLQRRARLSEDELSEVLQLIQTLNPRPGSTLSAAETEYVVPDVFVRKTNRRWTVELNGDATPKLRINSGYASLVRRADSSSDNQFLKNNLQEARWFLKSLQSRNETLLKVSTCIVEHQRGFLEYGPEAMKPLVLADIADAIGMHESTISRVTTRKYMHTPRGIFELKYFFSSHVGTSTGGEVSSTAIRALIRKLCDDENPRKPLSDSKIAKILADQDIQVARRTIAKYRESMAIPPSNERKRLV
ncbi:MAG TPA: RNA polymerase factor sigma-54 [Pseudomonadales bacterium]|nr:RNA polymerase factor sigma-54 [Pseudomonadales bacterium]